MGRTVGIVAKFCIRPEIFMYAAIVVFAAIFFVLTSFTENGFAQNLLSYYRQANEGNIFLPLLFIIILFAVRGFSFWITAAAKGLDPSLVFSKENLTKVLKRGIVLVKDAAIVGIPFLVAFYSLTSALGELNVLNSTRLIDEVLAQWDIATTGTFLPLSVAFIQYPVWMVAAIEFSFTYLVSGLTIFGLYLFQASQKLFREAAGAFFLGAIILFAGWALFPVMSPHDRFIDNVYELPISSEAQSYVDRYQPQKEIQEFLDFMRENKQGLNVMPTSTFPSAHVAWGVFLIYYSWRVRKWLLLFTVPFATLSSIGTFFFAQHYFVDVPAGIAVAVASIVVARYLAKKKENLI